MITKKIQGDIFTTKDRHIVFGLNVEGYHDCGFAGEVVSRGFSEIKHMEGRNPYTKEKLLLGEVISKKIGDITYHGIVSHSLKDGWEYAGMDVLEGLKEIKTDEQISAVVIGGGLIGALSGAPVKDIINAFEESDKKITLYY